MQRPQLFCINRCSTVHMHWYKSYKRPWQPSSATSRFPYLTRIGTRHPSPFTPFSRSIVNTAPKMFRSKRVPLPRVPTDEVIVAHPMDNNPSVRGMVMGCGYRFNEVLDCDKIHESLARLLDIGHWRKLGGRLRLNVNPSPPLPYCTKLLIHTIQNYRARGSWKFTFPRNSPLPAQRCGTRTPASPMSTLTSIPWLLTSLIPPTVHQYNPGITCTLTFSSPIKLSTASTTSSTATTRRSHYTQFRSAMQPSSASSGRIP